MQQHQLLFTEGLGTVEPYKGTLHVQPDATPRFFKPCPVPFAIKDTIGRELDRLEKLGIIKKVTHSEYQLWRFQRKMGSSASVVTTKLL